MADTVQKVTTDLSFHEGRLVPVGTLITVDVTKGTFTNENTPNLADPGSAVVNVATPVAPIGPTGPFPTMPQQVPPGAFQTPAGYVVPGGALLVAEGSQAAADAAAQGSVAEQNGVEEEGPVRRQAAEGTGDANVSAITPRPSDAFPAPDGGLNDAERRELEELRSFRTQAIAAGSSTLAARGPAPVENGDNSNATGSGADAQAGATDFNADAVIDGTVPEVAGRLDGLTREQLVAVRAAEQDREQPRTGVAHAIDAAIAKLDETGDQA